MFKSTFLKLATLKRTHNFKCINFDLQKNVTVLSYQTRKFNKSAQNKTSRQLKSLENRYMYQLISKTVECSPQNGSKIIEINNFEEFENVLNKNYRIRSGCIPTDIVDVFKAVQNFCTLNEILLSDKRFDNLVDGLMDHCEKLTDDEILELLLCLTKYPKCPTYREHNFHDIWSCLDDICCSRIPERDLEYLFKVANAWYLLDLGKISDFLFQMIDFCTKKAHKLTKEQVVKIFFYTNVCRKKVVAFEYEEALEKYLNQLTIDEFGIVALGYFKSMSKIKLTSICLAMMNAVEKECSTVNQITLASILKVLRFSKPGQLMPELNQMLDKLTGQIDRLSPQCCLHIAVIGTGLLFYHGNTLQKSTEKLVRLMDDVEQVRLKDIERIMNATTMVNFRPNVTPDLYKTAFKEIHTDQRKAEMAIYPKILPYILNYFSIVNMYSYELMDRILDVDYITQTYGKGMAGISKDIFSLDCCIDIECPDYKGNRLSPKFKYKLVKWFIDFTPSYDQYTKLTAHDKLFLDTLEHVKMIVGDEKLIRADHVTPHFPRPDLILCVDKSTKKFIEPPGFEKYILGDVRYAQGDPNLIWYALSVVGWNNTIRGTSLPVGMIVMKQRHLRILGYNSRLVIWNEYMKLSKDDKIRYIKSLLR